MAELPLLAQLAAAVQEDPDDRDAETIAELSEKVLAEGSVTGETLADVTRCRVVALIHIGEYAEALATIKGLSADMAAELCMEQAYCLYKTEAFDEAMALAQQGDSEGLLQMQGQVHYRRGEFVQAIENFQAVKDMMNDEDESQECLSNMVAAYAYAKDCDATTDEVFAQVGEQAVEEAASFELMFNVAASMLERGKAAEAQQVLEATQQVCRDNLEEEGLEEDEIQDEVTPIDVQLAYAHQMQRNYQAAMSAYQSAIKSKPSDAQVLAVAQNNVVTLKGDKDLFDSFKKSKAATAESTESKLTQRQKKAMAFNRALLLLHMNKLDQCADAVRALEAANPGDSVTGLLRAAMDLKRASPAKAEAALLEATKTSDNDVRTMLSLVQLQVASGALGKAAETLRSIQALAHRPGTVATLVALHEAEHDVAGAVGVVEAAVEHWRGEKSERSVKETVLREGAGYLLRRQHFESAAASFEQVLALRKNDPTAIAGLVQACGQFDPERAEKYLERIPALEGVDEIDAEELEEQTVEAANKGARRGATAALDTEDEAASAATAAAEAAAAEALAAKRRAQRQEKRRLTLEKRLPKALQGEDPSTWPALDPERWLPKRDRSYWKPRRHQKGKRITGGSQGAAITDRITKEYDRSDDAAHNQKEDEEASSPEAKSPQQQQKKKQEKKSKRPKR